LQGLYLQHALSCSVPLLTPHGVAHLFYPQSRGGLAEACTTESAKSLESALKSLLHLTREALRAGAAAANGEAEIARTSTF